MNGQTTRRSVVPEAEEIINGYFPVLDHGFVSLVDYMGTDADIERAARISYGAGTRKVSMTRGLIRYLRRHAHTTPSEMVEFKFHCCMPIFVARQWIRHRTASVNELSARYSLLPLLFYTPEAGDFAAQSQTNNQGRQGQGAEAAVYEKAVERWEDLRARASDAYGWLLEEDIARELSRIDLPVSIFTQWYWKIDLHNLLHFLRLRVDPHAQLEIREYGKVMAGMLARVAPLSYEAWIDYEVMGARLSAGERLALSRLIDADAQSQSVRGALEGMDSERVLDAKALGECGLSKREIGEFLAKLKAPERPDYALDLSRMRTAEEMRAKMESAVPFLDRSGQGE